MTGKKHTLRGGGGVKALAFLLALCLAAAGVPLAFTCLYLAEDYAFASESRSLNQIYTSALMEASISQDDTLYFLLLHRDHLSEQGQLELEYLTEQLDLRYPNLRYAILEDGETVATNAGAGEEMPQDAVLGYEATNYSLGQTLNVGYYLDMRADTGWTMRTGTVDSWRRTLRPGAFYYDAASISHLDDGSIEMDAYGYAEDGDDGYYDENGNYHDADGAYYDEDGNFHDAAGNVIDSDGNLLYSEDFAATEDETTAETEPAVEDAGETSVAYYVFSGTEAPVQCYVWADPLLTTSLDQAEEDSISLAYQSYLTGKALYENWFLTLAIALGGCILGYLALLVYGCWSAGWNRAGEVALRGLCRLPWELTLLGCGAGCLTALAGCIDFGRRIMSYSFAWYRLVSLGLAGALAGLSVMTFAYLTAAQARTHTLLDRSILVRLWRWGVGKGKTFVDGWPLFRKVALLCLAGIVLEVLWLIVLNDAIVYGGLMGYLMAVFPLAVMALYPCKWAADFARLRAEAKLLAEGDLSHKLDTNGMLPALKAHGEDLGRISQGIQKAVQDQLKSQRFKTELITNVSHDLKTPITSILNYVDLLNKLELEDPKAREYIQVLDRKSQRLKTLTDDLVEASKAASGTIAVNLEPIDLMQLLNQAVGEYDERLQAAALTPMVKGPTPPVVVQADGRHLWRILDNLLNNCCKYAMPGTRVYLDVTDGEGNWVLTVKNISADPLNVPAGELMKRFVRGDTARTSEGSGLGLSIARNLASAQGGDFELTVDGDLFKVTVTLPKGERREPPKETAREPSKEPAQEPSKEEKEAAPDAPKADPLAQVKEKVKSQVDRLLEKKP